MLKPKMLNLMFEGEIITSIRDGGTLNYGGLYVSPARAGWEFEGYSLVEAPEPAPESSLGMYRRAIQMHIDATARSRDYDSGISLSTYVNSTNPVWAAEAQAFVEWRDAVWAYAYGELAKVENGERPIPTVQDFISELPEIEWPE